MMLSANWRRGRLKAGSKSCLGTKKVGRLAQLVEQLIYTEKVTGSSPVSPTRIVLSGFFETKLEHFFKTNHTSVPRALKRHHAKRGASAEAEVRENALHTATTNLGNGGGVQKYGLGFAKTIFWGKGFRKTETDFSKRIFGIGFRPAGGVWGGMRGGFLFGFLAGGH